ncbi:MAG: endonuclease/exonuclease/phosphatase family protein [Candidatus Pacebacteria bacterium]|nr:endonuclease/exonuclease/phosphatase family protein [Candidatus Paceibacterota bacterium]
MGRSFIKIVTLNVERSKHLDLVLPFLEREQPDVLCVQELCAGDVEKFCEVMGEYFVTVPLAKHTVDGGECLFSIGIFSRHTIYKKEVSYHHGSADVVPLFKQEDQRTINRAFLWCDVVKGGEVFRIGTTHFTWTPDGEADDEQRKEVGDLLRILKEQKEIVFTGDFNAPRGREIFSRIAERYKDNVPPEYTTSIDGVIHRAGALPLMVDGIFSTPGYLVSNVRMVCGVSDHCALVAEVEKAE